MASTSNQPNTRDFQKEGASPCNDNIFFIRNTHNKVHPVPNQENVEEVERTNPTRDKSYPRVSIEDEGSDSSSNKSVTIEVESDDKITEKEKVRKSYLQVFVHFAPYLLFRPLRKEDGVRNKYVVCLQWACFGIFNILAFANTIGKIKYYVVLRKEMETLKFTSLLGYYLNNLVLRICCIHITCFKWEELHALSKQIENSDVSRGKYITSIVVVVAVISVGVALAWPVVQAGVLGHWQFAGMAFYHGDTFVTEVFRWSTEDDSNELFSKHLSTLESATCAGAAQILMEWAGKLQLYFIIDLSLTAAMTMHANTQVLADKIRLSRPQDHRDEVKTKFLILDNLLFCAYLAYHQGLAQPIIELLILDLLILAKVAWFIVSSVRSSSENDLFRKWVRTSYPNGGLRMKADEPKLEKIDLLDEITTDPIGVGSSIFFINRKFVYNFLGGVGSSSVFFYNLDQ